MRSPPRKQRAKTTTDTRQIATRPTPSLARAPSDLPRIGPITLMSGLSPALRGRPGIAGGLLQTWRARWGQGALCVNGTRYPCYKLGQVRGRNLDNRAAI